MGIAIKVENLSKAYQLGEIGTGTISRDLERYWAKIRGKEDPFLRIGETNDRSKKGESDIVWSLKDINFEINQGDAVGIIGRNGAGKSTLLKILSRVTSPTTGNIKVKGRIASLLEVGTGFHPELTGRENIFLNGAILGMRKAEIKKHFDAIVDFAGVERYIDTPVKRYSSGMYVRLAFAVAAHLESEILVVDEVLAVGDAEFQKKCLGKMGDLSKSEGRTVLFVSHNMGAVESLCKSSILLKNGEIKYIGNTNDTILNYKEFSISYQFKKSVENIELSHNLILSKLHLSSNKIDVFESLKFSITLYAKEQNSYSSLALFIYDIYNQKIAFIDLRSDGLFNSQLTNPRLNLEGEINNINLLPGIYNVGLHIQSSLCYKDFFNLIAFEVTERKADVLPYDLSLRGKVELYTEFNYL